MIHRDVHLMMEDSSVLNHNLKMHMKHIEEHVYVVMTLIHMQLVVIDHELNLYNHVILQQSMHYNDDQYQMYQDTH